MGEQMRVEWVNGRGEGGPISDQLVIFLNCEIPTFSTTLIFQHVSPETQQQLAARGLSDLTWIALPRRQTVVRAVDLYLPARGLSCSLA